MCFSVPKKVVSIDPTHITVESYTGNRQIIQSALPLAIGDFVIIDQGIATDILSPESAAEIINIMKELGGKDL